MQSKVDLLSELSAIVADAEADPDMTTADLVGVVAAFVGDTLTGMNAGGPIPFRLPGATRADLAVKLATEHGAVTSGALATATRCTPETARLTLAGLVKAGKMQRIGDKKATRYVLS